MIFTDIRYLMNLENILESILLQMNHPRIVMTNIMYNLELILLQMNHPRIAITNNMYNINRDIFI